VRKNEKAAFKLTPHPNPLPQGEREQDLPLVQGARGQDAHHSQGRANKNLLVGRTVLSAICSFNQGNMRALVNAFAQRFAGLEMGHALFGDFDLFA
jgi:hypothetical protein